MSWKDHDPATWDPSYVRLIYMTVAFAVWVAYKMVTKELG